MKNKFENFKRFKKWGTKWVFIDESVWSLDPLTSGIFFGIPVENFNLKYLKRFGFRLCKT
jgi:hypothetical protein